MDWIVKLRFIAVCIVVGNLITLSESPLLVRLNYPVSSLPGEGDHHPSTTTRAKCTVYIIIMICREVGIIIIYTQLYYNVASWVRTRQLFCTTTFTTGTFLHQFLALIVDIFISSIHNIIILFYYFFMILLFC